MKNNIITFTFLCATVTTFNTHGMLENKTDVKKLSKFDSLSVFLNFAQKYQPKFKEKLEQQLKKDIKDVIKNKSPFELVSQNEELSLTLPKKKFAVSNYFKTLFSSDYIDNDSKEFKSYVFDTNVSSETILLLGSYFKFFGTDNQTVVEQKILNSEYLLEIYRHADKLCIKPLMKFLNHNILEILINKGFINHIVEKHGIKNFEQTMDGYLCGHFDDILEECSKNPNYFDWENPAVITTHLNYDVRSSNPNIASLFSKNGRYFAHIIDYSQCRIYDTQTQKIIHTVNHELVIESIAFSPDNNYFATGSIDKTVQLYDINNQRTTTIKLPGKINFVEFTPDSRFIKCFSMFNTCIIYDIKAKTAKLLDESKIITSGDKRYIARHPNDGEDYPADRYEIFDCREQKTIETIRHKKGYAINAACFSSHGNYFHSTSNTMSQVYDIKNKKPILIINDHGEYIGTNTFSYDDLYFGAISNKKWKIYDLQKQEIIHIIEPDYKSDAYSIFFSPCGRSLAAVSRKGDIKIFKALSKEEIIEAIIKQGSSIKRIIREEILLQEIIQKALNDMKHKIEQNKAPKYNEPFYIEFWL